LALAPSNPRLRAGGAPVDLQLTFGAVGTMQVTRDGVTGGLYGSLLVRLIDAGGRPGAGAFVGRADGPGGARERSAGRGSPAGPAGDRRPGRGARRRRGWDGPRAGPVHAGDRVTMAVQLDSARLGSAPERATAFQTSVDIGAPGHVIPVRWRAATGATRAEVTEAAVTLIPDVVEEIHTDVPSKKDGAGWIIDVPANQRLRALTLKGFQ